MGMCIGLSFYRYLFQSQSVVEAPQVRKLRKNAWQVLRNPIVSQHGSSPDRAADTTINRHFVWSIFFCEVRKGLLYVGKNKCKIHIFAVLEQMLFFLGTCSFGQSRQIRSRDAILLSSIAGGRFKAFILAMTGVTVIFHPQSFTWRGSAGQALSCFI